MRLSSTLIFVSLALGLTVNGAPLSIRSDELAAFEENVVSSNENIILSRQRRPAARPRPATPAPARPATPPPVRPATPPPARPVAPPPARPATPPPARPVTPPPARPATPPPARPATPSRPATAQSSAAARPAASCARRARPRLVARVFTGGGIEICGIPSRANDIITKCQANTRRFGMVAGVLTPLDQTAGTTATGEDGERFECDHAFELQIAKETLTENGVCRALDNIIKAAGGASSGITKAALLEPVLIALNAQANLFFLSKDVNGQKGLIASQGVKLAGAARPANSQQVNVDAVQAYFANAGIATATQTLATTLDGLVTKLVNDAANDAICVINDKAGANPRGRALSARDTALTAVTTAKAQFSGSTLRTAFNRVVTFTNSL